MMIKWLQSDNTGQTDRLSKMVIDEVDSNNVFNHTYAQIAEN